MRVHAGKIRMRICARKIRHLENKYCFWFYYLVLRQALDLNCIIITATFVNTLSNAKFTPMDSCILAVFPQGARKARFSRLTKFSQVKFSAR